MQICFFELASATPKYYSILLKLSHNHFCTYINRSRGRELKLLTKFVFWDTLWPPVYNYTPCCVDHCPYSRAYLKSHQQLMVQHMISIGKDHKVDLHTHSPDKYNIGRDSQLLESKAHGTSVKPATKETDVRLSACD